MQNSYFAKYCCFLQGWQVFLFPSVAWEYILGCVASCVDADRDAIKTAFPSDTWERENIAAYPLQRQEIASLAKAKLKADKTAGSIQLDDNTLLSNIPAAAWEYQLGNRSALEWILDQHKEKKPKDPTIAEKFNNYRFAEYKEQVIDLLQRVCTVSIETVQIIDAMKTQS